MGEPNEEDRNRLNSQVNPAPVEPDTQEGPLEELLGALGLPKVYMTVTGDLVQVSEVAEATFKHLVNGMDSEGPHAWREEWNHLSNEDRFGLITTMADRMALTPIEETVAEPEDPEAKETVAESKVKPQKKPRGQSIDRKK